ncbi:hypothetical protein [Streptomyces sp. CB00455]|uniref:hypothetical protein n=1 Tax=Streptomyces sp. CB00455 TaxID=1703927 RepID=UPI0011612DD4|nr:hypothetical protein [Streptomyces sp. CB00455]
MLPPQMPTPHAEPSGSRAPGKPAVKLTNDPGAASRELRRLRTTGWWNPNKIEYADDAVIALGQFKRWLDKDYVAPGGGWSAKGEAAVKRANQGGAPL